MKWCHIADLYDRSNGAQTDTPGVPCLVHKLKYEHIHLTSFSKMRVDLAAQVSIHNNFYILHAILYMHNML